MEHISVLPNTYNIFIFGVRYRHKHICIGVYVYAYTHRLTHWWTEFLFQAS